MSDERSVSVGGSVVGSAVVTGDHSSAQAAFVAGGQNAVEALAAIRQVFAALPDVDPKALTRLEEAASEARKTQPDRTEVKSLLVQATRYARKAVGFAGEVAKLTPQLQKLAGWMGESWDDLAGLLHL